MSINKFTIQQSFAISAGAGSGKTYTLSRRYVNALLGFDFFTENENDGRFYESLKSASVSQIVTITYTEAAALEMKERIFSLIDEIISFESHTLTSGNYHSIQTAMKDLSSEQKAYVFSTLKKAMVESSNAKISTIHSFCLDIIRTNSDKARIDAKLDIIKEDEKANELSSIVYQVLNDQDNHSLVMSLSHTISLFFINGLISTYVSSSKFRQSFDAFNEQSISRDTYLDLIKELYPLPDVQVYLDEAINFLEEKLGNDSKKYCDFLTEYVSNFTHFNAVSWKALSIEKDILIQFNRKPFTQLKEIKEAIDTLKSIDSYAELYAPIDETNERIFFDKISDFKHLLHKIKNKYDLRLNELEKVDFDTIISKTREMISHITTDYKYIMVDEFQDTNATQFEIVRLACNKQTNLFVVGDNKQSIYSFQGAEIEVFNDAIADVHLFSSIEDMSINHRSDGVILKNVDTIFDSLLKVDSSYQLIKPNFEATAQSLKVFNKDRENKGTFSFLITNKENGDDVIEADTVALFIKNISEGLLPQYQHITSLIHDKKKAIAVVYDGRSKMLDLKKSLSSYGLECKVSASASFYHTREISDLFSTLKAIEILLRKKSDFTKFEKFYLTAALRSSCLHLSDNEIVSAINTQVFPERLMNWVIYAQEVPMSILVKKIIDDSNITGIYGYFDDTMQRVANVLKFLEYIIDFESTNGHDFFNLMKTIEKAIFFSDSTEDEAFFKSDNVESIELCTIHSTKGLAYPMVIMVNAEKSLYGQVNKESLKYNSFTINNEKRELVGFKIDGYSPLSLRVLKELDKRKHLAEKKRLLYVALTRAEHDIVISGLLKQKNDGTINVPTDSYLSMVATPLKRDIQELCDTCGDIKLIEVTAQESNKDITPVQHQWKELLFVNHDKPLESATQNNSSTSIDNEKAELGTLTHKFIELYGLQSIDTWDEIFDKHYVYDSNTKTAIQNSLKSFQSSDIFKDLQKAEKYYFELPFNDGQKNGFIDLVYQDSLTKEWTIVDFKTGKQTDEKVEKYNQQLSFYENVLMENGMNVSEIKILWV